MTTHHTPAGNALTDLILEIFRLNGRLVAAGDRLVARLGLSSARWQVLGAIALAPSPEPVAWLARSMGLNRQGVQRIVNELEHEGLVEFKTNPHHKRAHLVGFTRKGRATYDAATKLQIPWANALAEELSVRDLETARKIAAIIRDRLSGDAGNEP